MRETGQRDRSDPVTEVVTRRERISSSDRVICRRAFFCAISPASGFAVSCNAFLKLALIRMHPKGWFSKSIQFYLTKERGL